MENYKKKQNFVYFFSIISDISDYVEREFLRKYFLIHKNYKFIHNKP